MTTVPSSPRLVKDGLMSAASDSLVVPFPFLDASLRQEIWRRVFPAPTPTEGLDPVRLARLKVAGGNFQSMVLNAAFLAADAGEAFRMHDLLRAGRSEYAKMEKPFTEMETGSFPGTETTAKRRS